MKRTFNEAKSLASSGKWHEAWKVAQADEGLNHGVTFEEWKTYLQGKLREELNNKRLEGKKCVRFDGKLKLLAKLNSLNTLFRKMRLLSFASGQTKVIPLLYIRS
jgi:hypothetical protein